jgi:DNA-binding transcriptional regulator LsrR (DeoR family)
MQAETYLRDVKVDSAAALQLWNRGLNLRQIASAIAPGASRMSVSRAIQRAVKSGGVRIPHGEN